MGLPKGRTNNPKGKPKGARGKKTLQWEALADSITGKQAQNFQDHLNTLWKGDDAQKNQAAELFLKTVEYFKPKQARVETIMDGNTTITVKHE